MPTIMIGGFAELAALRELAAQHPVDVSTLMERLNTEEGARPHLEQMRRQSLRLPALPRDYFLTFSIETGHPGGTARHMSMSIEGVGRAPSPNTVWLVGEQLGFAGALADCFVWFHKTSDGGKAVNVVQLLGPNQAELSAVRH